MILDFSYFFDLSDWPFPELFTQNTPVWATLSRIEPFLKKIPLGKILGQVSPQAYLVNPHLISIGEGTVVEPGAYIQGPCLIGDHCTIRHGAYVRGNVITGNRCVIGHTTEVKNSLFLHDAHAAHFAYLGDSLLGNHVNLGAGTKCANLRLDRQEISVFYEGQRMATGLRKFGVILGDHTQTGCNSVTNPGTMMGKNSRCYPCTNLGGFIPSNSLVKSPVDLIITAIH